MKFSIVVATYNSEKYLGRMLSSVLCQTYPNYEIVVQDGGSTDGTLALLGEYAQKVDWRSEPDSGIYDAWNKALDRVTGDWAIFLGADDCLIGASLLARCAHYMRDLSDEILFAYGALAEGKDGVAQTIYNRPLYEVYRIFADNMGLPFPATFTRVPHLKKHKFDASYAIAGDFAFAAKHFTPYNIVRLPLYVSYMETGGISTNPKAKCTLFDERGRVLFTHILPKAQDIVTGCMQHYWDEDLKLEDV